MEVCVLVIKWHFYKFCGFIAHQNIDRVCDRDESKRKHNIAIVVTFSLKLKECWFHSNCEPWDPQKMFIHNQKRFTFENLSCKTICWNAEVIYLFVLLNSLLTYRHFQVRLGPIWRNERWGLPAQVGWRRLGNDWQGTVCRLRSWEIAHARILSLLPFQRWNVGQQRLAKRCFVYNQ